MKLFYFLFLMKASIQGSSEEGVGEKQDSKLSYCLKLKNEVVRKSKDLI